VITPLAVGNFGNQLKLANKHEAKAVVLFGEDEFARGEVMVKFLKTGEQLNFPLNEVVRALFERLRVKA
jgi:histidyl-tRNA synthetase